MAGFFGILHCVQDDSKNNSNSKSNGNGVLRARRDLPSRLTRLRRHFFLGLGERKWQPLRLPFFASLVVSLTC
ncbi:hypothetical protein RBB78_11530 [Tunturiibacter empetritectus]|uniref:hypothetical protein n=1 Tax=Tunturiibacter empetritectus TaxID=3069691 RepID=UPI003D9AF20F